MFIIRHIITDKNTRNWLLNDNICNEEDCVPNVIIDLEKPAYASCFSSTKILTFPERMFLLEFRMTMTFKLFPGILTLRFLNKKVFFGGFLRKTKK